MENREQFLLDKGLPKRRRADSPADDPKNAKRPAPPAAAPSSPAGRASLAVSSPEEPAPDYFVAQFLTMTGVTVSVHGLSRTGSSLQKCKMELFAQWQLARPGDRTKIPPML